MYADIHSEEMSINKFIANKELTMIKKFTAVNMDVLETEDGFIPY